MIKKAGYTIRPKTPRDKMHAQHKSAFNELDKEKKYYYNLFIERDAMHDFQHLCKKRGITAQTLVRQLVLDELAKMREESSAT